MHAFTSFGECDCAYFCLYSTQTRVLILFVFEDCIFLVFRIPLYAFHYSSCMCVFVCDCFAERDDKLWRLDSCFAPTACGFLATIPSGSVETTQTKHPEACLWLPAHRSDEIKRLPHMRISKPLRIARIPNAAYRDYMAVQCRCGSGASKASPEYWRSAQVNVGHTHATHQTTNGLPQTELFVFSKLTH